MKIALVAIAAVIATLLTGVGQAVAGGTPPADPGALVLLGTGVVGVALWGRRKFRR